MVAPTDPHGINTAGSPKKLDHAIDSWGYVHGRQDRTRLIIGGGVFLVGVLTIIVAFFLYRFGTDNYHKVSQEWHRSSQLEGEAFRRYINENEIKTVLRLVGTDDSDEVSYEEERAAAEASGAKLVIAKMAATRLPWRSELSTLFNALDNIETPVLVHCRQGADRTGLVTVIWLHDYRGTPLETAREQLAFFPYGHVEIGGPQAMDDFLDMYEAFTAAHPKEKLKIRDWVRQHYFEEKPGRAIAAWYDGVVYRPAG